MRKSKLLLFIPSIFPLIFLLFISTINNDTKIKLRLLIWETNSYTLGTYISISSIFGFLIGSIPSTFISTNTLQTSRKVIYNKFNDTYSDEEKGESIETFSFDNYIERDIKEASPTLSVPYRIIKQQTSHENYNIQDQNINNNMDAETVNRKRYEQSAEFSQFDDWFNFQEDNW